MGCIAGTVDNPKRWVRFRAGEPEEHEGRWCDRIEPHTSRASCSSCPAYRGARWDGTHATGIAPNGDLIGLSAAEYDAWQKATELADEDDDFSLLRLFFAGIEGGVGERTMRDNGDPDAQDRWAGYMRSYRAGMREEQLAQQREATRVRVARHRAAKKAAACNVSTPQAIQRSPSPPARACARVRARERGAYVTEEKHG